MTPPPDAIDAAAPQVLTCVQATIDTHVKIVQTFHQKGWYGRVECRYKTGEVSGYLTNADKQIFCIIEGKDMSCDPITWGHGSNVITPVPTRTPK